MHRSRKIIVAALTLIVVLALGTWLAARLSSDRSSRELVFPDGTRVKVLGAVRSGTMFTADEFWARPLRNVLPQRWQGWLPRISRITCGSGNTNDIVVFFGFDTSTGAGTVPWNWVAAVDDDGFRYPQSGGSCSTSAGTKSVHGVTLRGFPRRQQSFRLDFFDANQQLITHVRLPNPLPFPPPEQPWQAEPMPITRTNGPLALTLASAREETNRWGSQFLPKWQTHTLDPLWKNSRPGYVRVTDPVGNEGGFLSRKEKVWRVSAVHHRRRSVDFLAHEKLVITNLTVPAPGEMLTLDTSQDCAEVQVQFEGLFGAGTLFITNGLHRGMSPKVQFGWGTSSDGRTTIESIGSGKSFLLVNATGLLDRDELRLHLTDDQGRDIPLDESSGYHYRNGSRTRVYQRGFTITNSTPSLSLEIIVSRSLEFEFFINPADIALPQPGKK